MRILARLSGVDSTGSIALLLGCGLALALLASRSGYPASPDCDPEQEACRARSLDKQSQAIALRMAHKQRIARAVLVGRMPFLEAAACFRAIDQVLPPLECGCPRLLWCGATEEERYCREVITWVGSLIDDPDPCWRASLLDRLRTELADHLGRATLVLPQVPFAADLLTEQEDRPS